LKNLLTLLLVSFLAINLTAQEEQETKGVLIPSFSAYYAYEMPGGDLASRFGDNHKIGGTFNLKFANNVLLEFDGGYFFGTNLKEEAYTIFDGIKTDQGQITSQYGTPGSILLNERGFTLFTKFGYMIPVLKANDNSGPVVLAGVGFLQHKIRIDNESNDTPQVLGEYKKGYDHLTNGVAFNQFVGYRYYADNKMLNFFIGVEMTQAFTKNRRGFNYNTGEFDNKSRLDLMYSLKAGFVIPIARRQPNSFYMY
jgi:hypothetical protein